MARRKPLPRSEERSLEIEIEGKKYAGRYHTMGDQLEVRLNENLSTKKAQLSRSEPEFLAKILLGELVSDLHLKRNR